MKVNKEKFKDVDEDWIHTEVLGQRGKKSGFFSNCIIIIVLIFAVALLVIAFRGMFEKKDLSDLENLDNIKKQIEEEIPVIEKEEEEEKEEEKTEEVVYVVEAGDNLAYIGMEFGVDWQEIADRNELEEPFDLNVGQELIIPGVLKDIVDEEEESDGPSDSDDSTYTVKEGDTLAGIGLELGVPWESIAELNELEPPYALTVGQVLDISVE